MSKYFLIIGGLFLLLFGSLNISAQENSSKANEKKLLDAGLPISMPSPPYPKKAESERAGGAVEVQVTINEKGKVIAAKAISGHPLLRSASEKAALKAKFTRTLSEGKPVKATAVLVYNFLP